MTDDNGLLYMRQRYYNTEIKRFINQDILRGKITDSQSLNRYSYVEGDPINYMDPFGLSKLRNTLNSLTNNLDAINEFLSHPIRNTGKFLGDVWSNMDDHTKMNVLGALPVIGYIFDIANAISYFKEGEIGKGVESIIFALPTLNIAGGAGKIAQLFGKSKQAADVIGNTLQLCCTASAAFTAACKTGTGVANIIDKYAVGGAPLDGQFIADVTETASYGLMTTVFGRMTYKDYMSYTEAANTVVKGTIVNNEEIEWYTEEDFIQEQISKSGNGIGKVPGRVQSKINIAKGQTRYTPLDKDGNVIDAGWKHVVKRHFNGELSQGTSKFTITQDELKKILQSDNTVSATVKSLDDGQFVRTVDTGQIIGNTALKYGGGPTSWIKVFTDKAGNIITTYPIPEP